MLFLWPFNVNILYISVYVLNLYATPLIASDENNPAVLKWTFPVSSRIPLNEKRDKI